MNDINNKVLDTIIKSIQYLIDNSLKKTTKIYNGVIVSSNTDGSWNVKYNGETHAVNSYGTIQPSVNSVVKVFIPQGNQNLAFFM